MNIDTIYADFSISMSEFKKNPSQVAQAETPNPIYSLSDFNPSSLAVAPVAIITVSEVNLIPSSVNNSKGFFEKSTFETVLK